MLFEKNMGGFLQFCLSELHPSKIMLIAGLLPTLYNRMIIILIKI